MIKFISTLFLSLIFTTTYATHNKGGRIEVDQVSSFTFRITITTYTKTSSIQANRPVLDSVYMGDGSPAISFVRMSQLNLPDDVSLNTYINYYTYPGNGIFRIHFEDPNLNADIVNIPHSVNVPFYVETEIVVDANSCRYSSAHLLSIPIFKTPIGKDFVLSRSAYDSNWDSLSYELNICLGASGIPIPGYFIPPGISLNPFSGEFKWVGDSMTVTGEYCFAIYISKWRGGNYWGFVEEEFQVELDSITDSTYNFVTSSYPLNFISTILPGNPFNLHVEYYDSATSPSLGFYSEFFNPAMFTYTVNNYLVSGDFNWTPTIQDIRTTTYLLEFRGRKDLTYLLYVDGIRVDTACRPLVGINEINPGKDNITLFPNPASDKIQINVNGFNTDKIKIVLFDMTGKIVLEKYLPADGILNIFSLSAGMYIIKLENSDRIYYRKLLKD